VVSYISYFLLFLTLSGTTKSSNTCEGLGAAAAAAIASPTTGSSSWDWWCFGMNFSLQVDGKVTGDDTGWYAAAGKFAVSGRVAAVGG
jgi:hypothetical protein